VVQGGSVVVWGSSVVVQECLGGGSRWLGSGPKMAQCWLGGGPTVVQWFENERLKLEK